MTQQTISNDLRCFQTTCKPPRPKGAEAGIDKTLPPRSRGGGATPTSGAPTSGAVGPRLTTRACYTRRKQPSRETTAVTTRLGQCRGDPVVNLPAGSSQGRPPVRDWRGILGPIEAQAVVGIAGKAYEGR